MPEFRYVNKPIKRLDGVEKVTGAARFMQDMEIPGMLVGKLLYCPYSHARIKSIATDKAEKAAGVVAMFTHRDLPPGTAEIIGLDPGRVLPGETKVPVFLLRGWGVQGDGIVRCTGSPVAAVAAKTEEAAVEALDLIEVEYEPLPIVLDAEESEKPGAPQIYPDMPNNVIFDWNGEIGNVEKGFKEADVIYDEVGETQPQSHVTSDARGVIAWWEGDKPVVCYTHMTAWDNLLPGLAKAFGLAQSKVRIVGPSYMGGCYGGRASNDVYLLLMALLLAKKSRKPVKITLSREEDMLLLARCSTRLYAKIGVKRDGTVTAVDYKAYLNPGPWLHPGWASRYYTHLFKLIKCPNIKAAAKMTVTNRVFGGGPYRGFAYMEAFLVVQPILKKIAYDLGLDYLSLLEKSFWRAGEKVPHSPGQFLTISSSGIDEAVEKGKALIGWNDRKDPDEYLGVGYCLPAAPLRSANVELRLAKDGSIHLETGVVDVGAGQYTTLTYMAAEAIGVPPEFVHVSRSFNTDTQPYDAGQHGERTTFSTGLAILDAAKELRQKVFALASKRLGVKPEELELQEGTVFVKAGPEKRMPLGALGLTLVACGAFNPPADIAWTPGPVVSFVRLKVDKETGQITVGKLVMLNDVGRAINPPVVHTQNMGTLSGGLGFALTEELIYDRKGRVLNANPIYYHCPTILDIPEFQSVIIEPIDPIGPFGAKGAGEKVLTPSALAVSAAVFDALKTRCKTPITPDKVLQALGKLE